MKNEPLVLKLGPIEFKASFGQHTQRKLGVLAMLAMMPLLSGQATAWYYEEMLVGWRLATVAMLGVVFLRGVYLLATIPVIDSGYGEPDTIARIPEMQAQMVFGAEYDKGTGTHFLLIGVPTLQPYLVMLKTGELLDPQRVSGDRDSEDERNGAQVFPHYPLRRGQTVVRHGAQVSIDNQFAWTAARTRLLQN